MGCCAFAHIILLLKHPEEVRASRRALFLSQEEPFAFTEAVQFKPFVPAETLNACALIGLHLVAAGFDSGTSSSCSVFSLELRGFQDSVVRGALCGKKMYPWEQNYYNA